MSPSDLGYTCWRRRRKILFACVVQMNCTHSPDRRGYCLWREEAWTSRFSAHRDFLAFSCGENHVCQENHPEPQVKQVAVCGNNVREKPWQQSCNQSVVKPSLSACVTFWHQQKTAPPPPTTKGRGQEHISCYALRSSAVVNSCIKIIARFI